jgi:hypothetical protein
MSDPEDNLLGKADAFLKRYRSSAKPGIDEVPVLTEVVADPAAPSLRSATSSADATGTELEAMEKRLRQSLLDAVGPYLTDFLEEPLRARIEDHLRRTLAGLAEQIKADIDTLVRDAVARAVELEVARLRPPRSGRS